MMSTKKTDNAKLVSMYPKSIELFSTLENLLMDLEDIEQKIVNHYGQEMKSWKVKYNY